MIWNTNIIGRRKTAPLDWASRKFHGGTENLVVSM